MAKLNIDKAELEADIEALKNAKTDAEVDAIMAKYNDAIAEMDKKDEPKAKKAPAKKTTTKKATEAPKGRSYNGKYEVYEIGDGYQYNLKASNGEILFVSEVYTSREGISKAIDALKKNVENGEIRISKDKKGLFKFKLVAKNHRVLAISSTYTQEKSAVRASESFKSFAIKADIVDIEFEDADVKTATEIKIVSRENKQGGKFEIEKFEGEYSWDLKASNGQILCQAEGYTSKSGVMNSIDSFKKNAKEGTFKCVKDKNNNYCYKLYTPSGRVCAVGESYPTKTSAESAANSVVSFYQDAEIVEI